MCAVLCWLMLPVFEPHVQVFCNCYTWRGGLPTLCIPVHDYVFICVCVCVCAGILLHR